MEEDLAFLTNYTPDNLSHINIMLCGGVGAGKSSLINSFLTLFNPTVVHVAKKAKSTVSVTSEVTMYPLGSLRKNARGAKKTCIQLWDTPGFTYGESATTYQHSQLCHMIEGCIPDGFKGLDRTNLSVATSGFNRDPTVEDKMHVVCLMVNYQHLTERNSPYMARIAEFITCITDDSSPFRKSRYHAFSPS